jgi:hypothetical protein
MNRLLNKLIPLTTAAFLAGAIATPAARAFTIDTFDDGDTTIEIDVNTSPGTDNDTGLTGAVGGTRTISVTAVNTRDSTLYINDPFVTDSAGALFFEAQSSGNGTANILYDANGAGLGGVDVTEAGDNDRFRLAVIFANDVGAPNPLTTITFTVIDDQTTPETASVLTTFPSENFTGAFDVFFQRFSG